MTDTARFTITMTPGAELQAGSGRFDFTKTWTGCLEGTSTGTMLTAGDPASGSAGYVALEIFEGSFGGRQGTIAFQQSGTMAGGAPQLSYRISPGSGTDQLAEITGELEIADVGEDGVHVVTVTEQAAGESA